MAHRDAREALEAGVAEDVVLAPQDPSGRGTGQLAAGFVTSASSAASPAV